MWVPVLHINYDTLSEKEDAEGSGTVRERIKKARAFAKERFTKLGITYISKNKDIHSKNIDTEPNFPTDEVNGAEFSDNLLTVGALRNEVGEKDGVTGF